MHDPLDGARGRGPQLGRPADLARVERRLLAGHGEVEQGAGGVDVGGGVADGAVPHLRRHEGQRRSALHVGGIAGQV